PDHEGHRPGDVDDDRRRPLQAGGLADLRDRGLDRPGVGAPPRQRLGAGEGGHRLPAVLADQLGERDVAPLAPPRSVAMPVTVPVAVAVPRGPAARGVPWLGFGAVPTLGASAVAVAVCVGVPVSAAVALSVPVAMAVLEVAPMPVTVPVAMAVTMTVVAPLLVTVLVAVVMSLVVAVRLGRVRGQGDHRDEQPR